jgi:uncharacterized NAD-dependent epimerase/dehydratase family protein
MSGLAVLAEGLFDQRDAKTAHGVLRYADRDIVCVIDSTNAGRLANDVVPYAARAVPVVATVADAHALGADTLLIGVAPTGGRLTGEWRAVLGQALRLGITIEAGLHTILNEDSELVELAHLHGAKLVDLRLAPTALDVPRGPEYRPAGVRVVHSVGSDCAIGKMTVTLELDRAARDRGERSVFVATGQTGIAISGWGIAVDHVISDYIAGAAERLVEEGATRGDLLFVEGQGSLYHPAYSGVTLGLLHGSAPDALLLCHLEGADRIDGYPSVTLPPLPEIISFYEQAVAPVRDARVAAVALNTRPLASDDHAHRAIDAAQARTGIACDDPVRFGPDRLLDAVLGAVG